jgi:hypothetical protein
MKGQVPLHVLYPTIFNKSWHSLAYVVYMEKTVHPGCIRVTFLDPQ